jgi:hypothetical protein
MGDISRHRDIYLNTREVIPPALLGRCRLSRADLTYLEMGNYLTDVSQFRDPVTYIFAKQRIWREFVLPGARDEALLYRALGGLAALAGAAAAKYREEFASGTLAEVVKYTGAGVAVLGGLATILPSDTYAGIGGADDWIDQMFGTPIERTIGDPKKRDEKHYGYVGQFFRYFIEGVTQVLFAQDIQHQVQGEWGRIDRMPAAEVARVFEQFFTQYYPHEHTDQPPFIWDASQRPKSPHWYGPSKRQHTLADRDIGVMNAVDNHYIQYLSEGLADVENEWRRLRPDDVDGRRRLLVRTGKLLHGVEDWYFHSNVVELFRLRAHKPPKAAGESDEDFLKRFVREVAAQHPEFVNAQDGAEKLRLQRRLFRRLRFPAYDRGTRTQSAGILSKSRMSSLSLHHAYPAFPSQQDTAHTLLHALENLERQATPSNSSAPSSIPPWAPCVLQKLAAAQGGQGQHLVQQRARARGVNPAVVAAALASSGSPQDDRVKAVIIDVLREWLPLVITLLNESERQRLAANVDPLQWPMNSTAPRPVGPPGDHEIEQQLKRHKTALEPKPSAHGPPENNYERAARYLVDCGFLNAAGQRALVTAFAIDQKSQKLLEDAPGAGGFLIQFAVQDLQRSLDKGDAAAVELNRRASSMFDAASDNGAFQENIGSHSLMSKDTLQSPPFFDDAKVLASVASASVFHIMLEQVSAPAGGTRLPWKAILHHFIRYPSAGGWERRAVDFFQANRRIPTYAELPELARLVDAARNSPAAREPWRKGEKDDELKDRYIELETQLSAYRYP